ncbi:erythromycin esterase family protein (plasmid) [Chryseobacterium panacisoli]|uniref:Erythromycin esterase family protein n=2 Tax=Chryseobacterium panacisoli TaxID=1807141 RepID=A0A5D9A1E7_9FLAO|nr:erythromycin esterase family protein [Chryseobacterium panacisoli]
MPESFLMNHYIQEGKDNPKDILKGMYFWLWQTEETLTFVEWLKKYNENHNSKVFFDGFDIQYAKGAIDQIRKTYQENQLPEQEIDDLEIALKENNRGFRTYTKKSQKIISEYLITNLVIGYWKIFYFVKQDQAQIKMNLQKPMLLILLII